MLAAGESALADFRVKDTSFLAELKRIVQELLPGNQETMLTDQPLDEFEEVLDPREIQQALREIKDIKRELKRFQKELKKIPNSGDDLNQINVLLEQVAGFESNIQSSPTRDNIQEFREEQIWEQVNKFRAKVEIPRELKQWNSGIKKAERLLKQKSYQKLGLNLENASAKLNEIKASLARVQEAYNSGDLETAMEEFDEVRQDFHPGEITSALQRMKDLVNKLKAVKDEQIRQQINEALQEITTAFNEGEYRLARELLDENFDGLMKMIYRAYTVGKKKGVDKEKFSELMENFEEKMKQNAEQKKRVIEEKRSGPEPIQQPQPIQPQSIQPIQPLPPATQTPPAESVPQPTP